MITIYFVQHCTLKCCVKELRILACRLFWHCSSWWFYPVNTNKMCYKLFLCVCVNCWKNKNIVLSVMVQTMTKRGLNHLPQKLEAKRLKVLFCSGLEWQKCKIFMKSQGWSQTSEAELQKNIDVAHIGHEVLTMEITVWSVVMCH